MELIDKAAVVAQANIEISNCRLAAQEGILTEFGKGKLEGLEGIVDFLDTLEVKEVNLQEEVRKWQQKHFEGIGYVLDGSGGWIGRTSLLDIAEHFFELGLNASIRI